MACRIDACSSRAEDSASRQPMSNNLCRDEQISGLIFDSGLFIKANSSSRVYRYLGIAAEDRSIPAASGVDDLDEEPSTMTESLADDALPEPPSLFEVNIFAAGKGVDASVLAACRALRGCSLGLSITTEPVTA